MALDYFLKIDGIPGESTDSKHKGELEVLSWSWGMSQSESPGGGGGGGGAGKINVQDLSFVSAVSKASPKLLEACAGGKHIKEAVLVGRKAGKGQLEFLTYTLSDLLVSSYQTGGSEGSEIVADQVSLNFSKLQVEYKEQKADGSLGGSTKAGFDVKHNKISP